MSDAAATVQPVEGPIGSIARGFSEQGRAIGFGPRTAAVAALGAIAAVAMIAGFATGTHRELAILSVAAGGILFLVGLRRAEIPLAVLVVMIPIEQLFVIDDSLGTLSRYADILFIVAYALPRIGRLRFRLGVMPVAGWAFLFWAVLSTTWSINIDSTVAEMPTLVLLFVTAVCVGGLVVEQPAIVGRLMWAYSLAAAATGLLAIATFASVGEIAGERISGLDNQNPGYFAAILLPAFIFTAFELFAGRRIVLGAVTSGLLGLALIVSGARGTWLAAAIVVFLVLLPRLGRLQRAVALGSLAIAFVIALQVPAIGALISDRTDNAVSTGGAGRTDIWSVALTIYETAPVTGVGLQNFANAFTPEAVRNTNVSPDFYDPYVPARAQYRSPHNLVVQILVELGPLGLFLLAWFLVPLVLRQGWGRYGAAVQAMMVGLAVNALFIDLVNRRQLWLLIGFAAGLLYLQRHRELLPSTGS